MYYFIKNRRENTHNHLQTNIFQSSNDFILAYKMNNYKK